MNILEWTCLSNVIIDKSIWKSLDLCTQCSSVSPPAGMVGVISALEFSLAGITRGQEIEQRELCLSIYFEMTPTFESLCVLAFVVLRPFSGLWVGITPP